MLHQRDVNSATIVRNRGLVWLENEFSTSGDKKPMKPG